jgi:thiol-disulfide isomerase/thioredoxin
MYKPSKFVFSLLCLSSLVLTASCSAANSDNISENQASPSTTDIAQVNPGVVEVKSGEAPLAAEVQDKPVSTTDVAQVNPGAAEVKSVGGPLAAEIQNKPVLVDVFASWCSACKNIAPTLSQLKQDYDGKVHFVILDVSDRSTTAEAEAKAKRLGLSEFLAANKSQTGMLTIIDPKTGNILAQHRNNPKLEDYQTVLDAALSQ